MKKGFTLIELIIAIALLTTVMMAVASIFSVVIKTYHLESQRGFFQKDLNFVSDNITRDIKQSQLVQSYAPYTLSSTTLILNLPALDSSGNFIYSGSQLQTDTVIYTQSGTGLIKILYPNQLSTRAVGVTPGSATTLISDNVSNLNFSYSPNITAPRQVTFSITLSRTSGARTITLTGGDTADLRNKP